MKGPLTYFPKQISSFPWRQTWQSHQGRKGAESQRQKPGLRPALHLSPLPAPDTCPAGPAGGEWALRDPRLPRLPPPAASPPGPLCSCQDAAPGPLLCSVLPPAGPTAPPVSGLVFFCTSPPQRGPACRQPCWTAAPAVLATPVTPCWGPTTPVSHISFPARASAEW